MANNGAKEPLLLGSLDPAAQKAKRQLNKRRILHSRSAPPPDIVSPETNGNESSPRFESIFGNLHPSFKKVAIYLAVYLGVGAVIFYLVGNQIKGLKTDGILDAVYFTIVTMTTVGYGDLVPNSDLTKLLACAFVFSGMALVGLILSKAADYLVEKQEVLLVKAMHMRRKVGLTKILKEVESNKTRYKFFLVFFLLLILIIAGTIFLVTVEKLDIVDALYCVCSTITTLGYGDKSFSTLAGRIFAVFWILTGTIFLAQFFLYLAELNTESRQKALVKWVLTRKFTNLDLEAADLDEDGTVGAAEFVIYKLKEMGKISQEDISLVMQEFEELDVDQSEQASLSSFPRLQLWLRQDLVFQEELQASLWSHVEPERVERVKKKDNPIPLTKLQEPPLLLAPASSLNPSLLQSLVCTPSPMRAPPVKPLKQRKPKAKDPNKREMSHEEKHKLGIGLQSLPPEKRERVVQIIRKRNGHLKQEGDEIKLDIEAVDTQILWELDRLVTNWKKMVSKIKRQALMVNDNVASNKGNGVNSQLVGFPLLNGFA